ncbi:DUF1656 domain-containing protein [Alginatibacterium sediminis]|uniref:DUF1656 domain-containing protein n=1 Tax=Alginatibacterium sediminis TaxID=2164068 RepID=A0A420EB39_9ALTE|nr:DUF1656 domain-containing protein [Alginatibacterium sediminis]RKF17898.1 DUF1656 domain-containing protein [Alginatibacterium sediminis]
MDLILHKRFIVAYLPLYSKPTPKPIEQSDDVMPHELVIGDVYLSPYLLVFVLSYLMTSLTNWVIAMTGTHQYFAAPALAQLSLLIIFGSLVSHFMTLV